MTALARSLAVGSLDVGAPPQLFTTGVYRNVSEKPTKVELTKISKKLLAAAEAGDSSATASLLADFIKVGNIDRDYAAVPGGNFDPTQRRNAGGVPRETRDPPASLPRSPHRQGGPSLTAGCPSIAQRPAPSRSRGRWGPLPTRSTSRCLAMRKSWASRAAPCPWCEARARMSSGLPGDSRRGTDRRGERGRRAV